jgi:hypothetical protein
VQVVLPARGFASVPCIFFVFIVVLESDWTSATAGRV